MDPVVTTIPNQAVPTRIRMAPAGTTIQSLISPLHCPNGFQPRDPLQPRLVGQRHLRSISRHRRRLGQRQDQLLPQPGCVLTWLYFQLFFEFIFLFQPTTTTTRRTTTTTRPTTTTRRTTTTQRVIPTTRCPLSAQNPDGSCGYNYPKPACPNPNPDGTCGYDYPKPDQSFTLPQRVPTTRPVTTTTTRRPTPPQEYLPPSTTTRTTTRPTTTTTRRTTTTTRPTTTTRRTTTTTRPTTTTQRIIPTTKCPLSAQNPDGSCGYSYPKPDNSFELPQRVPTTTTTRRTTPSQEYLPPTTTTRRTTTTTRPTTTTTRVSNIPL